MLLQSKHLQYHKVYRFHPPKSNLCFHHIVNTISNSNSLDIVNKFNRIFYRFTTQRQSSKKRRPEWRNKRISFPCTKKENLINVPEFSLIPYYPMAMAGKKESSLDQTIKFIIPKVFLKFSIFFYFQKLLDFFSLLKCLSLLILKILFKLNPLFKSQDFPRRKKNTFFIF